MTIIGLCNVNSLKHGTLSMPSSVVQVTFSRHQEWLLVSNVNLLVCTYLCRTFIIHCVCVRAKKLTTMFPAKQTFKRMVMQTTQEMNPSMHGETIKLPITCLRLGSR